MKSVEIVAIIIGVISVFYSIKQNPICWLYGMISCILLVYYFYSVHFYAQMILQIISIIQCAYGLIRWNNIDNKEVQQIGFKRAYTLIAMSMMIGILFTLLTNKTNDNWLYLDGIGGIVALLATYLLVMKKIEAWWIFMINNILLIILCIHQGIYGIMIYNMLLIIMSVIGYKEWKKDLNLV